VLREGVPESRRGDSGGESGAPNVADQAAANAARGDAAAAVVEEQGIFVGIGGQQTDAHVHPGRHRGLGLSAERDDPLFRAFAANLQQALAKVDVVQVDADELAHAYARCVEKLEPRAVANPER